MTTESLFRVLQRDNESNEFLLLELAETADGAIAATDSDPIRVSTTSDVDDVEYILELLTPGHLLYATLEGSEPYDVVDVEHRGGVTFELLNPWLPPYLALHFWRERQEAMDSPPQGRIVEGIVDDDTVDPLSTPNQIGEMTLIFTDESRPSVSEQDFFHHRHIEPFLQAFGELSKEPMEVIAADPHGLPFWCVLAFDSEQSRIAQKIRAQYGSGATTNFVPNPLVNITDTTGQSEEPTNPDQNPRQVVGHEYQGMPEDMIPDKTGQGTLDLIRELIAMANGFSLRGFSAFHNSNDKTVSLQAVSTVSPAQYSDIVETIGDATMGYIRLTMQIYEAAESSPHDDPKSLVSDGTLPDPALLARAEAIFRQYQALHRGFTQKMESIDIRAYVPDIFGSYSKAKQRELKKEAPYLEPLPDTLQSLVDQQRDTMYILETNVEDCKKIVDVGTTGSDLQYVTPLTSETANSEYKEFIDLRDEVIDQAGEFRDSNDDGFEAWIDQLMFGRFTSVDPSYATSRCQARFEWFGSPEIEFTSFRTV